MSNSPKIDTKQFKKLASRNTILPLGLAAVLSIIFVGLVLHLVNSNKWVDHTNLVITKANRALKLCIDAETGLRGYLLTGKESFLEPYNNSRQHTDLALAELETLVEDNPGQLGRLRMMRSQFKEWEKFAVEMLEKRRSFAEVRKSIAAENGKRITDSLRELFEEFIRMEESLRSKRVEDTQNAVRLALTLTVIGSIIAGIILALYSRKQLKTVSGIYGSALEKETTQNEALQTQAWFKSVQIEMGERTKGNQAVSVVASEILKLLCETLDAKAGALYLLDGDYLTMSASYAFSEEEEKKHARVREGSSLIGQIPRSRQTLMLDPAPERYITISSATGESGPRAVLIAPALASGEVKAVVELAFLRRLTERDRELMQIVSENIATAITSAQYRTRLQELLEESQKLTEELQAQQEELKVNNEELEEQARALQQSQARLEGQQTELEQTNLQLNEQAQQLEAQNDELNQARAGLEAKTQELERASHYKSQFLANMSHELRTPLNSTLILAQLLIDNKSNRLGEEEIEFARTILSSSNDLLTLINDILDLAKVEAGKTELHPEKVTVQSILQNLSRTFQPSAEQKKIKLQIETKPGTPDTITIDKTRLEQILKNLVSNAIKFTSQGSVTIAVSADGDRILFDVTDTGIGIPSDKHASIFEAFQQADGTTSRQFGGTGLGLTISRDLAFLLGGEIRLSSALGRGSTFSLLVPTGSEKKEETVQGLVPILARTTEEESLQAKARNARAAARRLETGSKVRDDRDKLDPKLRILMIVEDDLAFAKILYDLSREQKFQSLVAQTAEEAIDLAEEHIPHAVILDMNLPDHSGLFVLDRLKANPKTRHIPVHVISMQDHSNVALQMGAMGYLVKPADRSKLVDVIKKLEDKLSQDFKKVLVVEDNDVQREGIKRLIADSGVEVMTVRTGKEALNALKQISFDCMVLDLSLPDMTGHEVLERMSEQSESVSNPPVIVYTARSLTNEEEAQLQRYSRSIILKGAKSPERLLSEISLFLHQVEAKLPIAQQKALQELRDREKTFEGKKILLVDDDVRNIFALNSALQPRGAVTEIARNGKEALAKLTANSDIDLVLMDIMMPEMDGYEAMRAIRKIPKFKRLPIIAVTAKAMSDDQEKCIEAGASDYLAKPIDLPKLLSLLRVWVQTGGSSHLI